MPLSYNLLLIILSPLLVLGLIKHIVSNSAPLKEKAIYFMQKLGFWFNKLKDFNKQISKQNCIMVHAASVGELISAYSLIKELSASYPILVTTNTLSSKLLFNNLFEKQIKNFKFPIRHCYLPFDFANRIRYFLKISNPQQVYIIDTEIWGNLFTILSQKQIPLRLINARLGGKSLKSNGFMKHFILIALNRVTAIYPKSELDKNNLLQFGVDKLKLKSTINLKILSALEVANLQALKNKFNKTGLESGFILLASSRTNEEVLFAKSYQKQNLKQILVIAPRHPERRHSIKRKMRKAKIINFQFMSDAQTINENTKIFIVDKIGYLLAMLQNAKLVIIGGSWLDKHGGHNFLEAATFGKPIIVGQDMADFAEEIKLFIQAKAIMQFQNFSEFSNFNLKKYLKNQKELDRLGLTAKQTLERLYKSEKKKLLQALQENDNK